MAWNVTMSHLLDPVALYLYHYSLCSRLCSLAHCQILNKDKSSLISLCMGSVYMYVTMYTHMHYILLWLYYTIVCHTPRAKNWSSHDRTDWTDSYGLACFQPSLWYAIYYNIISCDGCILGGHFAYQILLCTCKSLKIHLLLNLLQMYIVV